jgi:hypothetical protein
LVVVVLQMRCWILCVWLLGSHKLSAQWLSAAESLFVGCSLPSRHQPDVFCGILPAGSAAEKRKNHWGIRSTWPYGNTGLQETSLAWASIGSEGVVTASFCRTGMPTMAQWRIHCGYGKWLADQWMLMVHARWLVTSGSGLLSSAETDARLKLMYKPSDQLVVGLQADGLNAFFRRQESGYGLAMEASVGIDINPSVFIHTSIRKNVERAISGQWGFQYKMHTRAALRASIQWQPFVVSSMVLIQLNAGIRLGVGSAFHPVLGVSPGMQLHFL